MSPTESVRSAYQWAGIVIADRKSSMVLLLCARTVQTIVETNVGQNDDYEAAYGALLGLVRKWRKPPKRPWNDEPGICSGQSKAAEVLGKLLEGEEAEA